MYYDQYKNQRIRETNIEGQMFWFGTKSNYDNLLRLDLPMIRRKVSTKICNMVFIDMVPKACVIFPMRSFMVSV